MRRINLEKESFSRMNEDLTMTELKQGIKAFRLESSGGPDGFTPRLLTYLVKLVPYSFHRAMNEMVTVAEKPYKLIKRV